MYTGNLDSAIGRLDADARRIFRAAVRSVSPDRLIAQATSSRGFAPVAAARRVILLACGKAAASLGSAFLANARTDVRTGLITIPHGSSLPRFPAGLEVMTSGHPIPDSYGVVAGRRALDLARTAQAGDLVVLLLSGGGSALWSVPVAGVDLADVQTTIRNLLRSGADIAELNTVRKHVSEIKGGRLAAAAAPASVLTLAISDVVGDDPSTIASGPTVADPTTYTDALAVLDRHGGRAAYPRPVVRHLVAGVAGLRAETPKPGDPVVNDTVFRIIGSNSEALRGAAVEARRLGYDVRIVSPALVGEASAAGYGAADRLVSEPPGHGRCVLWGGETTVTVRGDGQGGRNQELALAAAIRLDGVDRPIVLLSGGTDGVDGPTDAAGAVVSPLTVGRARGRDLEPAAFLEDNDSNTLFRQTGGLLFTGPTGTNVMDVVVGLVGAEVIG